jgi:hypothetical protein
VILKMRLPAMQKIITGKFRRITTGADGNVGAIGAKVVDAMRDDYTTARARKIMVIY